MLREKTLNSSPNCLICFSGPVGHHMWVRTCLNFGHSLCLRIVKPWSKYPSIRILATEKHSNQSNISPFEEI